ncbi:MAG: outer membrane beta-barrel protein, partial [Polyangiaceae bacterium]
MRKTGFSLLSLVAGVCLLPSAAFAQDAAPAPAPAAPAPAPAPAAEPTPAPAAAPAPAAPTAGEAEVAPAPAPAPPADAAPPAPTYPQTIIQGGVEGTYSRILAAPHNADTTAPTRAYDSSNGFLLNQASLFVKHQLNENVYAQIRFDAGANAGINNFGASKLFDVREAFAVATGSGFTFTAGKFTTYEGIEVVDGWLNPT